MIENYTVIDLEMTGLAAKTDEILELGAVRVRNGVISDTYQAVLHTKRPLSNQVIALTGITPQMVEEGEKPEEAMQEFFAFLGEDILVGQNLIFDYSFLKQWAVNHKQTYECKAVDTLKLARKFLPPDQKKDLDSLCQYFSIRRQGAHRALEDATDTYRVFEKLKEQYGDFDETAFEAKPLRYNAKKQTPATGRQLSFLKKYIEYYEISPEQSIEGLTRSEASRLTDRLIAQYGKMPK